MLYSIKPNVYCISLNDRTTDLFEGLWPVTKEGVSYNAYVVKDEKKKVLIDLAKAFKSDEFFDELDKIVPISELDYVVMNHLEPDHGGLITTMRRINPDITILCTDIAKEMLAKFYNITENVQAVSDGETLNLGTRTLQFFHAPFVHWPETMVTYETIDNILFSCDAFGGYGAIRGAIFDDENKKDDFDFYVKESLRYYANIVAKFSGQVQRAINKLVDAGIKIECIAPSHGLIWRENPEKIIELYQRWAGYMLGETEPGITVLYASMYGNTEAMMNAVVQGISKAAVPVEVFDVARIPVSYILPSLWTKKGIVIGAPTYEAGLFPYMVHVLDMAKRKRILNKKVARFGSKGWSGGAQKELEDLLERNKWELVDHFEFTGHATKEELMKGEDFGTRFAQLIKGS
ncbi:MAG: FprA family A-type flavoprotein [Promethearchaeota archaeon]